MVIFKCIFTLMSVHAAVLGAALHLCRRRGGWTFRPAEIVAALPGLNAASVRTHVMSRCCVNAPPHHAHRWPHFKRVERGLYQVLPAMRGRPPETLAGAPLPPGAGGGAALGAPGVEPRAGGRPGAAGSAPEEPLFFVEVRDRGGRYVVESAELSGEIAGTSLGTVLARVVEVVRETLRKEGMPAAPLRARLLLQVDPLAGPLPQPVAAYASHIDRTLIRENLRLSVEERLEKLLDWAEAMDEIRGAVQRSPGGKGGR
jgi:hypothetical protein